jgi:TonB-dependent starch-binding outer membrane protein SusC
MKKHRLLLLCLLFFLSLQLSAQNYVITGMVANTKTGEKLDGVSISVDNLPRGATTKADGSFSITVPAGSKVLNFSFVGFAPRSVGISEKRTFDITLDQVGTTLNDVVLIGYGTQRKRDLPALSLPFPPRMSTRRRLPGPIK